MNNWLDKYEEGGMVLKQKTNDNYGKRENANEGYSTAGPGWIGEGTTNKGFNYNGAWGGQFAMGGTIPGSVGFTYARTKGIPSEGPYAKKTLPSAQNGKEMQYYQEGLDFKPKMISKNGGWLDAYDVPKAQNGKTKSPIFTDDPKDKRIKAYNDSLNLYNSSEDYYNRLKKVSFDLPNIGVSEENLKKIRNENYKKYPWDKLNMPISNEKSSRKFQPISKYNIYVSDVGDIESNRYKKPVQPVVYKKPDPVLQPRNRVDQELMEIAPDTPQLMQGPNIQLQQRAIQNLPYQVDWRMNNEDRTNYFVNEEEGAEFLKELNPITGLPEYRNRGDYNASGRYTAADKLRGLKKGGIIQDDRGQWAHPGEITQINSPYITMKGVPYPVLGIADTGEEQMMYPGQDYEFEGAEYVTEYPKGKRPKKAKNGVNQADEKTLEHLDQLTNFTNYNKPTIGGWLDKY